MIRAYLALSTANVSDALDRLEIDGAPRGILPLWPGAQKLVGRAVTMKLLPVDQGSASPVLGALEAILTGQPGGILVIDQSGRTDVNSLGGMATFTAVRQGLIGAVIDGVTRDVDDMRTWGFPCTGRLLSSSRPATVAPSRATACRFNWPGYRCPPATC